MALRPSAAPRPPVGSLRTWQAVTRSTGSGSASGRTGRVTSSAEPDNHDHGLVFTIPVITDDFGPWLQKVIRDHGIAAACEPRVGRGSERCRSQRAVPVAASGAGR